ncbi:MAG TPA: hypothetical protein VGN96_01420 [Roseococcus sp.]|jgi:hypothetical protein|nr:hypothetical protein [Roseococcus sp.]
MHRRHLAALPFLALAPGAARANEALGARLNGQHPAYYYQEAARLFGAGQREDAVFLFYLGQLRFRTHLLARPDLPADGDRALFAALSDSVGRPVNEWAFGDVPALVRIMDAVLAHDESQPDRFTPPREFPEAHRGVREGLARFREQVGASVENIRQQRAARGLENRPPR